MFHSFSAKKTKKKNLKQKTQMNFKVWVIHSIYTITN